MKKIFIVAFFGLIACTTETKQKADDPYTIEQIAMHPHVCYCESMRSCSGSAVPMKYDRLDIECGAASRLFATS